jgi:hypothetical protein
MPFSFFFVLYIFFRYFRTLRWINTSILVIVDCSPLFPGLADAACVWRVHRICPCFAIAVVVDCGHGLDLGTPQPTLFESLHMQTSFASLLSGS